MNKVYGISLIFLFFGLFLANASAKDSEILVVSYEGTGNMYKELNGAFKKYYEEKTGKKIKTKLSLGGSAKQATAVINGLEADIINFALAYDIYALESANLIIPGWQKRLPNNSVPFTTTVVFLVRKGNPKNIRDWDDLVKPGISVITPNPKTSGGARWNYLAALGYVLKKTNGDETKAKEFIKKLFKNVPVLNSGARGATNTFVQRRIGDVLLAWENEAHLIVNELCKGEFEIVTPSMSILAEPPVASVDKFVDKHGTRAVAEAYLRFLYTEEGQKIAANHYYRPIDKKIMASFSKVTHKIKLFTIDEVFGNWLKIQKIHFADGGIFDEIFLNKN